MPQVVVVGAGSAGCVVAGRISENPSNDVVLLEAGPDYPGPSDAPPDITDVDLVGQTTHDWGLITDDGGHARDGALVVGSEPGTVALLRGKVVGGSSAINAGNAMRALRWDFERWVSLGNAEWDWPTCLAGFIDLEDDTAPGPWHGRGGPFPVRRYDASELTAVHTAFVEAARQAGHPVIIDHNAPDALGVGVIPMNRLGSLRVNAAWTHLTPAVRARPNLRIVPNAEVDSVEVTDGRVRAVRSDAVGSFPADVVVLAAGSIGSPTILLRSGIGDRSHLDAVGVPVRHHLPGVGQGLREHSATAVVFGADSARIGPSVPLAQTLLTASSGLSGDAPIDLHLIPLAMQPGVLGVAVGVMRPQATGSVTLQSSSARHAPRINLGLFSEASDRAVARAGVSLVRALAAIEPLQSMLGPEIFPGPDLHGDALDAAITATPNLYYHACGTCRMGPAGDPGAVVDQFGAVHGVTGLHIIDASIFPDIPSVPTNATTMMIAERCARALLTGLSDIGRVAPTAGR